jgi:hypothetical protein
MVSTSTSTSTCPRGHALEDNAVYCTVCWVRVAPEDEQAIAARRRRRRRVWFPLFGAGAVALGVAAGALAASMSGGQDPQVVMAGEAVASASPASAAAVPTPAASEEAVSVTADPLAATVADPVITGGNSCVAEVHDLQVPCSTDNEQLAFTVCVPGNAGTVEARMRANEDLPWSDVSSDAVIGEQGECATGELAAAVVVDAATAGRDGGIWRLVVSDANGERLWRSRIVVDDAS